MKKMSGESVHNEVMRRLSQKHLASTYRQSHRGFTIELSDLSRDGERKYRCVVSGKGLKEDFTSEESTVKVISDAVKIIDGWYDDDLVG